MTTAEIIADKDRQLADLRELNAWLRIQLDEALRLLRYPLPVSRPRSGAERSRRYRDGKRDELRDERDVTRDDNRDERDVGGLIGGVPSVPSENDLGEDEPLGEAREKKEQGESLRGGKRHGGDACSAEWLAFRETFPRTDRTSWREAQRVFGKLSLVDQAAAIGGATIYASTEPGEFTKGAQSWLRERRWETAGDRPAASVSGNGQRAKNEPDYSGITEWSRRMEARRQEQGA